jgi:hypothetical protein
MEPAKLKAAATCNAAADRFDESPLAFWDRYGRRTVDALHERADPRRAECANLQCPQLAAIDQAGMVKVRRHRDPLFPAEVDELGGKAPADERMGRQLVRPGLV